MRDFHLRPIIHCFLSSTVVRPPRPRPASSALATFAATAKGSVAFSDAWSGSSPSPRGITAPMCAMRRTGPQVPLMIFVGDRDDGKTHLVFVKEWNWNMLCQRAFSKDFVSRNHRAIHWRLCSVDFSVLGCYLLAGTGLMTSFIIPHTYISTYPQIVMSDHFLDSLNNDLP